MSVNDTPREKVARKIQSRAVAGAATATFLVRSDEAPPVRIS
jgi:hypothetical protein